MLWCAKNKIHCDTLCQRLPLPLVKEEETMKGEDERRGGEGGRMDVVAGKWQENHNGGNPEHAARKALIRIATHVFWHSGCDPCTILRSRGTMLCSSLTGIGDSVAIGRCRSEGLIACCAEGP